MRQSAKTPSHVDPTQALLDVIQTRPRPEDVAELVLSLLSGLKEKHRSLLSRAAAGSLRQGVFDYSSMATRFADVVGADRLVNRTASLLKTPTVPSAAECLQPKHVAAFLTLAAAQLHAAPECLSRSQRMAKAQRQATAGMPAKRLYNRLFRMLGRLKGRLERLTWNQQKAEAARTAKSAGATMLTYEDLAEDLPTAAFVAYLSARMNVRSVFTNASQVRAFDTVAEGLLEHAKAGRPNWWAIAMVHPEPDVLKYLTDQQKGRLLGVWTAKLGSYATMLAELARTNNYDLDRCIVRRGDDSTSWNAVAGAWNKARDHWFALLYDMGMDSILDTYCPGKVLRLMAADVVAWHGRTGGLHPDTAVWQVLPKPWEVFAGQATSTRENVGFAALNVYKDQPEKAQSWFGARPNRVPAKFTPTPELVHGVSISSPFLAERMRRAGWFSGQGLRDRLET